jgi:hypothetical protein
MVAEEGPGMLRGTVKKWSWMTGIANSQATAGRKERGNYSGGENTMARQRRELLIQQPHKFPLVQTIDKPTHESAQISRSCRDGDSMPGYIR